MIFKLHEYIIPTWYFNLKPSKDYGYFTDVSSDPDLARKIPVDSSYQSEEAQRRDQAYRAFELGVIDRTKNTVSGIDVWSEQTKLPLVDEYRFIRKFHHPLRVLFTLIIRVLSLKNPFAEVSAYLKSKGHMAKDNFNRDHVKYPDFETFDCELLKEAPLVSIVIPTLNRYEYLDDVFRDLEKQTYTNFEVLVADQSEPYREDFYDNWKLDIKPWFQPEKALWLARNTAIQRASGSIIALTEDDVRFEPTWLEHHLRCLEYFNTDISSGVFFPEGATIPPHRNYFKYSAQLATGNVVLYKHIFETCGMFDRNFEKQRMGDGEYGMRAYLNGFKSVSNPKAYCEDVKAPVGGLRQMGSWDAFRPKSFWAPRPIPSVLYFFRTYFSSKAVWVSVIANLPPSVIPYKFKQVKWLKPLGLLLTLVLIPFLIVQFMRSWKRSSKMLKSPKIAPFKAEAIS